MLLSKVHVKNFRCLRDVRLDLRDPTVLVGANSAGKSSLLAALAFFFEGSSLEPEDVFARSREPISVECTFTDLNAADRAAFGPYGLGSQMVLRVTWRDGEVRRTGRGRRCTTFESVRSQPGQSMAKAWRELREANPGMGLAEARSKAAVEQAMLTWEQENPDDCVVVDDQDANSLFGYGSVGRAKLLDRFQFVMVPAVRDAAQDAIERKDSLLSRLLVAVAEQRAQANEQLKTIQEKAQREYDDAIGRSHGPVLDDLSKRLTDQLQRYVPSASLNLEPTPSSVAVEPPRVTLRGGEHGDLTDLGRQGHGFRRAFIISVLEYLAESSTGDDPDRPTLFLAIEEPELYQHPPRARHFHRTLCRLADGPSIQVCYATHSPYFVTADRFDSLAIFHREPLTTEDEQTVVTTASLDDIATELPDSEKGAPRRYLARTMSPTFREAFFARAVLLVEGPTDQAVFETASELRGNPLSAEGITCAWVGKGALPTAAAIIRHLDIPVYVVFDADGSASDGDKCENCQRQKTDRTSAIRSNRALLRSLGSPEADFPPQQVNAAWACFDTEMEDSIPRLDRELAQIDSEEGWSGKSPEAYAEAIRRLGADEISQPVWDIIEKVRALAS